MRALIVPCIGGILGLCIGIYLIFSLPSSFGSELRGPTLGIMAFLVIGLFPVGCLFLGIWAAQLLREIEE